MPKRTLRAVCAAAAASATLATLVLAAASPAGAAGTGHKFFLTPSGGPAIATNTNCSLSSPPVPADNCAMVGYEASGRNFRFAQALITVPNHTGDVQVDPSIYVGLDNSTPTAYNYARVGVEPCTFDVDTCPLGWEAFASTDRAVLLGAVHVRDGVRGPVTVTHPITSVGAGVLVNVYYSLSKGTAYFHITMPDGTSFADRHQVPGAVYTQAQAVADWTSAVAADGTTPLPATPSAATHVTQFFQGRFTTLGGQRGTFDGPWTLNPVEATSNGFPSPSGTLIGAPSFLSTDGDSFHGLFGDSFGVWLYSF